MNNMNTEQHDMPETTSDAEQGSKLYVPAAIVIAGFVIAGAIFATRGGDIAGVQNVQQPPPTNNKSALAEANVRPVDENDHVRGPENAPVTIVEYSDLECPFCAAIHPSLQQALTDYEGNVRWVYRHFPLTNIHPEALPAAVASECVADLAGNDAFWEFADTIFTRQGEMGSALYAELAGSLGIDADAFAQCLQDSSITDRVARDLEEAQAAGGTGTPYTVVMSADGTAVPFSGALPYTQIQPIIEQALAN